MNSIETEEIKKGKGFLCGVDEAGRGPLAGPVVAAAVIYSDKLNHLGIKDSKKLSPKKRKEIYNLIFHSTPAWGVGIAWPREIDKLNILGGTMVAMKKAVENVEASISPKTIDLIMVDGLQVIRNFDRTQRAIKFGDSLSVTIGAASIIAKVVRDNIMNGYHNLYPQYNFIKNKGYGTKEHMQRIDELGELSIHRKSFNLIRRVK